MIRIPERLAHILLAASEVSMGRQIITVILEDGRVFDGAIVTEGWITAVARSATIPFRAEDIKHIIVTNGHTQH